MASVASTPTNAATAALQSIPCAQLQVRYVAQSRVDLPGTPASVWRGQLGAALHRVGQATPSKHEPSVYEALFRTPRSSVRVPDRPSRILGPVGLGGQHVPHPFVLRMKRPDQRTGPLRLATGETTEWTVGLVDTGVRFLPALSGVLDRLGDGIGKRVPRSNGPPRRGTLRLRRATLRLGRISLTLYEGTRWRLPRTCDAALYDAVSAQEQRVLEPAPSGGETSALSGLRVRFETPVRLTHNDDVITSPPALSSSALAQACYRRWAALALCYTADPPSADRLDAAFDEACALGQTTEIVGRSLEAVERTRYSARQERTLRRIGLQGSIRLGGPSDRLAQWARWIEAVSPLHVGKSTSMGFGRVTADC